MNSSSYLCTDIASFLYFRQFLVHFFSVKFNFSATRHWFRFYAVVLHIFVTGRLSERINTLCGAVVSAYREEPIDIGCQFVDIVLTL